MCLNGRRWAALSVLAATVASQGVVGAAAETVTSATNSTSSLTFSGCLASCIIASGCSSSGLECICEEARDSSFLGNVVQCLVRSCLLISDESQSEAIAAVEDNFIDVVQSECSADGLAVPTAKIKEAEATLTSLVSRLLPTSTTTTTVTKTAKHKTTASTATTTGDGLTPAIGSTTAATSTSLRTIKSTIAVLTSATSTTTSTTASLSSATTTSTTASSSSATTTPDTASTDEATEPSTTSPATPPDTLSTMQTATTSSSTKTSKTTKTQSASGPNTTDGTPFTNTNAAAAPQSLAAWPALLVAVLSLAVATAARQLAS